MANIGGPNVSTTRRRVLKGVGAASLSTLLGGSLPASTSAATGDRIVLGDFESGFDGWETNDANERKRITKEERPVAVTRGRYGLQVTTAGDGRPTIRNETRVQDASFSTHPYLFATVTPGRVFGSGSAVRVRFRLHYETDGLLGEVIDVVQSVPTTVEPHVTSVVTWDTTGVDETKLANATRLDVVAAPERSLLDDGDAGDEWSVVYDDVHLSDDRERVEMIQMAHHWEQLERAHGAYRETRVESRIDGRELGVFVFEDGATVPYTVERLADGVLRYVVDGLLFRLGGELR